MTSPDLSPGSSPWDTNRTNRTQSSGGKYESAPFLTPPHFVTNKLSETGDQMGRVRTNEITPETYFEWKGKIIGVTH